MPKEKIILKDMLFNKQKVEFIAKNIGEVYSEFRYDEFVENTLKLFPELELKQRIFHIMDMLELYLPSDYKTAVNILIKSLPAALDENKTDDDFGYFILSPYGEYIAKHGCCEKYLDFSLEAMQECTKRFSMEFAIRPFLKQFPDETLNYVKKWSQDHNYHIRRLSSEGIRPNLPWGGKVDIGLENTFKILDKLYSDSTSYVFRSVANNMNDCSKIDAQKVIDKLLEWKNSGKQNDKNMNYIISHSLRSLIKYGDKQALGLLGYNKPEICVNNFKIHTGEVRLGEKLHFGFDVVSQDYQADQNLMIDYLIYFQMANGKQSSKVFKISKKNINSSAIIQISKFHPLKSMTTKKLYSGIHSVELQINGYSFGKLDFEFIAE